MVFILTNVNRWKMWLLRQFFYSWSHFNIRVASLIFSKEKKIQKFFILKLKKYYLAS